MKKYSLTEEHRAQLKPWADKWIANAMSTERIDKDRIREAIKGLYRAAHLEPPPDQRIVFVPSPFVARFAGGAAAAIWHLRAATYDATDAATYAAAHAATYAATDAATDAATRTAHAATRAATYAAAHAATRTAHAATHAATYAAAHAATRAATDAATRAATRTAHAATHAATDAATYAATHAATDAATYAATYAATHAEEQSLWYTGISTSSMRMVMMDLTGSDIGVRCAQLAYRMWNGGNQWSGYVAFLSFFRHIAKLDIDYSKWQHYEVAAEAGPRVMHEKFCIVSDRPTKLMVDDQNRPHCEDGPFCEWADGTALWAWHGVYTPAWIIAHPERITPELIDAETNSQVRAVMVERYGLDRYLSSGDTIDSVGDYRLISKPFGDGMTMKALIMRCPTTSAVYVHPVHPDVQTVNQALAWKRGHDDFKKASAYSEGMLWER